MLDIRRILVPVDFSECSTAALAYAARLAERFGAEIEILHVWGPPTTYGPPLGELTVVMPEGRTTIAELMRTRSAKELAALVSDVTRATRAQVRPKTTIGDPADAILKTASSGRHDLIVMGTHGRTGLARMMMGSVAEKVVRRAPCPVTTVRLPVRATSAPRTEVRS